MLTPCATHSVAGEKLSKVLEKHGVKFKAKSMEMTLVDGHTQNTEVLMATIDIIVQRKLITTEIIVLKHARVNRTLLGVDFLNSCRNCFRSQKEIMVFHWNPPKEIKFCQSTA